MLASLSSSFRHIRPVALVRLLLGILRPLLIVGALGAVLGDSAWHFIGRKFGPGVFNRRDSRLFQPVNVERAQAFFERHGGLALILWRLPRCRQVRIQSASVHVFVFPKGQPSP